MSQLPHFSIFHLLINPPTEPTYRSVLYLAAGF